MAAGMRLLTGAVGIALAALVFAVSVPAASVDHGKFNPLITLRYSGTYDSFEYTATDRTPDDRYFGVSPATVHFGWTYTWQGRFGDLRHTAKKWQAESLIGTFRREDDYGLAQGGGGDGFCSYRQNPGHYPLVALARALYEPGQGFDWPNGSFECRQPPPNSSDVRNAFVLRATSGPYPCASGLGLLLGHPGVQRHTVFRLSLATGGTISPKPLRVERTGVSEGHAELKTSFTMHRDRLHDYRAGPSGLGSRAGAPPPLLHTVAGEGTRLLR